VGSTLSWLLLYLALYPEVQSKCREEIDQVLGSRNVTLDDKPEMPYVEVKYFLQFIDGSATNDLLPFFIHALFCRS
jgi:hypothetical protein